MCQGFSIWSKEVLNNVISFYLKVLCILEFLNSLTSKYKGKSKFKNMSRETMTAIHKDRHLEIYDKGGF